MAENLLCLNDSGLFFFSELIINASIEQEGGKARSRVRDMLETVETVKVIAGSSHTQLKLGVNEVL